MSDSTPESEHARRVLDAILVSLKRQSEVINKQTLLIDEHSEIIAQMAELQDATSKAVRGLQEAVFGAEEVRAKYAEANEQASKESGNEGSGEGGMVN